MTATRPLDLDGVTTRFIVVDGHAIHHDESCRDAVEVQRSGRSHVTSQPRCANQCSRWRGWEGDRCWGSVAAMSTSRHILVAVGWPYANGVQHLGHMAGAYLPPDVFARYHRICLLYTSPSPRDGLLSRMPSSA